jgi:hypothetical protein
LVWFWARSEETEKGTQNSSHAAAEHSLPIREIVEGGSWMERLKTLIKGTDLIVAPVALNAIMARLAEDAGF